MIRLAAALAGIFLSLAAGFASAAPDDQARDGAGAESEIIGRYLLQAPDGRVVTDGDFPGRLQLITFGYTFCPDVCPTTLATITQVLTLLGDKADRVQPIFISVDPERDTPAVLGRYTAFFDPRILGLTGSPELVRAAANHFQVTYRKFLEPGQPTDRYSVDHTAGMFVLSPDGGYVARFGYTTPAAQIAAHLQTLIAQLPRGR